MGFTRSIPRTARKRHECAICYASIQPGEPCREWVMSPNWEGNDRWQRAYAHPVAECYQPPDPGLTMRMGGAK